MAQEKLVWSMSKRGLRHFSLFLPWSLGWEPMERESLDTPTFLTLQLAGRTQGALGMTDRNLAARPMDCLVRPSKEVGDC